MTSTEGGVLFHGGGTRIRSAIEDPSMSMDAGDCLLNELINEDTALLCGEDIEVSSSVLAHLSIGEQRVLGLPEPFPFSVRISVSGILTDENHQYDYHFLDGSGQLFAQVDRIGSTISCGALGPYMLDAELFDLLQAIDSHRERSEKGMRDSFLRFAEIKGLAKRTGSLLDAYLQGEEIITADQLTVQLQRTESGSLEVEPVLCESTPDGRGREPLVDHADFVHQVDAFRTTRQIYNLPNGRVVLTEEQERGIQQIKEVRHLSGEAKDNFIACPQAFLDPDLIDLDAFSDRVIEIGEYQYKAFPFLKAAKEPWLPPEGGIVINGEVLPIPLGEAPELLEAITRALAQGDIVVEWNGRSIPVGPEIVGALEELVVEVGRSKEPANDSESVSEGEDERNNLILRIVDNFEGDDYESTRVTRSHESLPLLPQCLRDGVQLFPHQLYGLTWLQKRWHMGAKGVIVADDMGLGKTLLALSFAAWCRELMDAGIRHSRPILIVAPVTLLENWQAEYEKRMDAIFGAPLVLHGGELRRLRTEDNGQIDIGEIAKAGLVLTTYETIRNHQLALGRIEWSIAILDEAQRVKTPTARVTMAAKAMKYDFGIAMTGTPVENSWVDLWSLMDFAQPGHLESLKAFTRDYQTPLGKEETDRSALGRNLQAKVGPYMLRRMKEDVIEGLPTKTVKQHVREMPESQLRRYVDLVTKAKAARGESGAAGGTSVLQLIALLRDVSLCPLLPFYDDIALAGMPAEDLINSSARLQAAFDVMDDIRQRREKGIVFLVSRRLQRVVQRLIRERYGVHAYIVNGKVSGPKRQQLVDAFQAIEGFGFIILSTEAAGVGLNITAANHVIHLSRVWNPAKEDQATDRVYRIGQERPVVVHLPMAVSSSLASYGWTTFDQKLDTLLSEKRELSRSVLLPSVLDDGEMAAFADTMLDGADVESTAVVGDGDAIETAETDQAIDSWVDHITPEVFEDLIATLYRRLSYQVVRTPRSRDHGADVVAVPHGTDSMALLIQCKHTINPDRVLSAGGVHEVLSAIPHYSREYSRNFCPVVVTNAVDISGPGVMLAGTNGVELVTRSKLCDMIKSNGIGGKDLGPSVVSEHVEE